MKKNTKYNYNTMFYTFYPELGVFNGNSMISQKKITGLLKVIVQHY
jgi:hypothetical protein